MRRVAVDWDGTCVTEAWPEMGEWLPGAVDALKELAQEYDEVVIHTCRVAPFEMDEKTPRNPADQIYKIEWMLKEEGMPNNVHVWTKPFKPPAEIYLDNRALRFGSWGRAMEAINPVGDQRHPISQRFYDLLEDAAELHAKKQADYGRGDDPFANVRSSTDWGMPAWVGAMVRLNDKVKRLQTYARKGTLANEGVVDSFQDIAVYAIIAQILWEEEYA